MSGQSERPEIELIAIVASAGGLEAMTAVLDGLPASPSAAIVLGQHLGGQGSALVDILRRKTGRTVAWAVEGGTLEPGVVTVCPPRQVLELLPDRTFALRPSGRTVLERPLDALLDSVADVLGPGAVAVVLTGMGDDASRGALAVRRAGGLVIAQDEATSEHASMPQAAVAAGATDVTLALHDIGTAVSAVLAGAPLPRPSSERAQAARLFSGAGEVAQLGRELDWSATSLGPVGRWPAALVTAVRLALAAPMPTCLLWGPDLVQVYNDAYRAVMGAKHPSGLGQSNRECWPEVWHLNQPRFEQVLAGEAVQVREAHYPVTRSGELMEAWFDLYYAPAADETGVVRGVYATVVEKTTEVLARRRLRTLNELSATAAPFSSDRQQAIDRAVDVLAGNSGDLPFVIGYALGDRPLSAKLAGATGVTEGTSAAPSWIGPQHADSWPLIPLLQRGEQEERWVEDVRARFTDLAAVMGDAAPEAALVAPLRAPSGREPLGALILGANPRLPLDDAYRTFMSSVAARVATLVSGAEEHHRERQRTEQLADLDRLRTEFFANVSHEFRTPLTLMLAPLQELSENTSDPEVRERADLATRNAQRLLRLVGTLLDFSELESAGYAPVAEEIDLGALTRDLVAMFRSAAEAAGLELDLTVWDEPLIATIDGAMWEKIVSNLLSNALKFTWEGRIEVELRDRKRHVELIVRDTGIGIPEDQLEDVFKRFHRVRATEARSVEGTGIGLALVGELVRRRHGRIRLASEVGVGTEFTVWVTKELRPQATSPEGREQPLGRLAASQAEEASRWTRPAPDRDDAAPDVQTAAHPSRERVLVVDDNRDMRTYLQRLLSETWDVEVAADGAEALERIERQTPDLVVADVMMPGLDGFALLRRIREHDRFAALPVIFVTAHVGEQAAIDGVRAGADDYIVKPFTARELTARVRAQLELAAVRAQNDRRFRALVDASFDVVYRMSADWSEMRILAGRGFLADNAAAIDTWMERYVDARDRPAVRRAVDDAITTASAFELEHRVRRPDGSLRWAHSRAVPILDARGAITEWIGAATDTTAAHAEVAAPPAAAPAVRGR